MAATTVLDEGRAVEVEGSTDGGRLVVATADLEAATGFVRKPEGLCRDEVCVPVRPGSGLEVAGGIDVTALAGALGRAIAVDDGVAYLGAAAAERADRLRSLEAPDFSLPDLAGVHHSLSAHRGRKVLLAAYASW